MDKFKQELRQIHKKAVSSDHRVCSYCGASSECQDHALPLDYFHENREIAAVMYNIQGYKTVYSCRSCNALAGYSWANSFSERKAIILERFEKKFKKEIKAKDWTEEEINECRGMLRISLKEAVLWDRFVKLRHENLKSSQPIFYNG